MTVPGFIEACYECDRCGGCGTSASETIQSPTDNLDDFIDDEISKPGKVGRIEMSEEQKKKILDVMHTLSCIRDGKCSQRQGVSKACWEVLDEVLAGTQEGER